MESIFDKFPTPPVAELLGWKLVDQDAERGWVRIEFDAKPIFRNPAGYIQGGIVAAMLDDTMGPAALVQLEGPRAGQALEDEGDHVAALGDAHGLRVHLAPRRARLDVVEEEALAVLEAEDARPIGDPAVPVGPPADPHGVEHARHRARRADRGREVAPEHHPGLAGEDVVDG